MVSRAPRQYRPATGKTRSVFRADRCRTQARRAHMTIANESFEDVSAINVPPAGTGRCVLPRTSPPARARSPIVGESGSLLSVMRQADRVAGTDATVLILGET